MLLPAIQQVKTSLLINTRRSDPKPQTPNFSNPGAKKGGHHLHGPAQIAVKLAHGHIGLVHTHDWRVDRVDAVDLIIDNGITAASTPRGEGRRVLLRRFDDAPIQIVDSLFRVWGLGSKI